MWNKENSTWVRDAREGGRSSWRRSAMHGLARARRVAGLCICSRIDASSMPAWPENVAKEIPGRMA